MFGMLTRNFLAIIVLRKPIFLIPHGPLLNQRYFTYLCTRSGWVWSIVLCYPNLALFWSRCCDTKWIAFLQLMCQCLLMIDGLLPLLIMFHYSLYEQYCNCFCYILLKFGVSWHAYDVQREGLIDLSLNCTLCFFCNLSIVCFVSQLLRVILGINCHVYKKSISWPQGFSRILCIFLTCSSVLITYMVETINEFA